MGSGAGRTRRSPNGAGLVAIVVVVFFLAAIADRPSTAEPPRSARSPGAEAAPARAGDPTARSGVTGREPARGAREHAQVTAGPATGARRVALTFDDGPDPNWTPIVLDLLSQHRVQATFCLVGAHVHRHSWLVRRIVRDGHALCNHTWSHPMRLDRAGPGAIRRQLESTHRAILSASGGVAPRYFRAPGGAWSPAVRAEAARLGMTTLGWSVDPLDWSAPPAGTIVSRVLARAEPGSIVLLHDGYGNRAATVAALRVILPALLDRGYGFVIP